MKQNVKNIERIQRALEQVQKLTPQQINNLTSQQNFNELRLARLNNLKFQIFQSQNEQKGREEGNQLKLNSQKSQTSKIGSQSGVRWPSFKEMPIIRVKQSQRNYQKEFASKIQEFRRDVRKQQEKKFNLQNANLIQNPNITGTKSNGIFSAVFNNQTGPNLINTQNQQKDQTSFLNVQDPTKYSSPFDVSALTPKGPLFGAQLLNKTSQISFPQKPFLFSPLKPQQTQIPVPSVFNKPLGQQNNDKKFVGFQIPSKQQESKQKTKNSGFMPKPISNQSSSSIFDKKFQTPQPSQPAPINKNAGLFSESNPLSLKNPSTNQLKFNNTNNSLQNPKNSQEPVQPKFNIFEKRFNVQSQPAKPIQLKGGLFSSSNPWAQKDQKTNKNNITVPTANTKFQNNTNLQINIQNKAPQVQKNQQISGQSHHQKQQVKDKKQQIQPSIQNKSLIVPNSLNLDSKQAQNKSHVNDQHDPSKNTVNEKSAGSSSKLFQNITIKPSDNKFSLLFSSSPSKQQTPAYQSGSLFTNQLNTTNQGKLAPKLQIKSAVPQLLPKKQQSSNPPSTNNKQFFATELSKKQSQSNEKSDNKSTNPPNIFLRNLQNDKNIFQNPGSTNNKTLDSNIFRQHLSSSNNAGGFLKQAQKNNLLDQMNKSNDNKKTNQTFGDLVKPKSDNIFSQNKFGNTNQSSNSLFGNSPKTNIFGNPGSSGGAIFQQQQQSVSFFPNQNDEEEEQIQEDQDDNILQDKSQIDPSKSTGNYKYEESIVLFRQTALKVKKGTQSLIENASISIQKVPGGKNYILIIRLANKVIYFTGTILPGVSQVAKINDKQFKNLRISKIMFVGEDKKLVSQQIKIQFKQEKTGNAFFRQFNQACKK